MFYPESRSSKSKATDNRRSLPRRSWEAYTASEVEQIKKDYPHSRYHKLREERMKCTPQIGTPFPFMRLPAELRLKVYKLLLLLDSPIELWPHAKQNTMYCANVGRSKAIRRFVALRHTLRLLRVSQQINSEAAQVFYGSNNFRFSGINGWMVLSAFLHTIGSRHYQFLQHLTIHVPFPGEDHLAYPTSTNRTWQEHACIQRRNQHKNFHARLRRTFRIPDLWSYDWSIADCVSKLSTSDLRTLRLVLPPTYYIDHSSSLDWYWERLQFLKDKVDTLRNEEGIKPLRVGFVFLKLKDGGQEVLDAARVWHPWHWRYTGQVKRMIGEIGERKWIETIEYGVHDNDGAYDLLDKKACLEITGPKALDKEEFDEEDWGSGYKGQRV
ncbi:hypothetical protein K504DRAFT_456199 [Pleomassaria siparia CBS 279.74]|uniref:F-box domain-containing protein n=1 Tax=Pleomassaria siparia CBS 279.74 TaxID=1314801 RepID=A0A6G1K5K5_9PLEO|nr:hypothetical protein K504DRAFT_456199 [Pleomassaria siparia CBS 279.74]